MSLTMVSIGEQKIIKEIRAKEQVKRHLQNLGFITGEKIEVISENSSGLILMVKGSKIALNRGMANKIIVN
ncbi:MAG: ferrous iron transport protein A [Intestinibacter sp.]|uniref:FeoA family protein n=1 Tax=Intestinibacter sp. TaxID=1965304 RepID=UPI0025C4168A|nr:FeoA family protein [Intestinibacter sp.]MCI6736947.1 ferrous iron transport protein A [Intestinibacter sp.]